MTLQQFKSMSWVVLEVFLITVVLFPIGYAFARYPGALTIVLGGLAFLIAAMFGGEHPPLRRNIISASGGFFFTLLFLLFLKLVGVDNFSAFSENKILSSDALKKYYMGLFTWGTSVFLDVFFIV